MADNPTVLLETSSGDILIELFPDKAPKTVANFLQYVDDGFYANTIFHRVIPGFMIQGGGLGARLDEKAVKEAVENEADNGLKKRARDHCHGPPPATRTALRPSFSSIWWTMIF